MIGFLERVAGRLLLLPNALIAIGVFLVLRSGFNLFQGSRLAAPVDGRQVQFIVGGIVLFAIGLTIRIIIGRRRAATRSSNEAMRARATTTGTTASHGAANTLAQWGPAAPPATRPFPPGAAPTPPTVPGPPPAAGGPQAPSAGHAGWPRPPGGAHPGGAQPGGGAPTR